MSDALDARPADDEVNTWLDDVRYWLVKRWDIEELEQDKTYKGKPFGRQNRDWEGLKGRMTPGDEIWTYSSPGETWERLSGRAGIALVRDGRVIGEILIMMN